MILLDFAKAFDKVPHARLLHKLDFYGIRGNLKSWIGSFLSGRKQRVVLDGCTSSEADVASGVPQGTVLGPLLFLAFINDLPEWAKHSDTRLFADDSLLFRQIKNQQDADLLQQDLKALEEWEKTWQMSFHPSKCTVIRIPSQRKKLIQTSYTLHGHTLEVEESSKYLGINISEDLTWDRHIYQVAGKANRTLGFLRRNFRDCTIPVKKATYTAMVRPAMEYSSAVWDPVSQKHIQLLELVQRRAARYVFNNYTDRTPGCVTQMVKDLHWETLEERRRSGRLCMLYRITNNLVDIEPSIYLQASDNRTRGQARFFQQRIEYPAYRNSFFPHTAREWNSLPSSVTEATSLEGFRQLLSLAQSTQ